MLQPYRFASIKEGQISFAELTAVTEVHIFLRLLSNFIFKVIFINWTRRAWCKINQSTCDRLLQN